MLIAIAGITAIVLSGCTTSQNTTQSATSIQQPISYDVKTAYVPLTANLPLFVALEQGFFKQNGLSVEASEATSPNDIVAALVSGKLILLRFSHITLFSPPRHNIRILLNYFLPAKKRKPIIPPI